MSEGTTFKDRHREMQEIARELALLRSGNLRHREGDPQERLLLISEAALTCLALERFVRIVLGSDAAPSDTLYNLLQKAVSSRRRLLRLPWDDQEDGIRRVVNVRNTLLHGNYETAAQAEGCATVAEYFKTKFASETERMFEILDHLMKQIDPHSGLPLAP